MRSSRVTSNARSRGRAGGADNDTMRSSRMFSRYPDSVRSSSSITRRTAAG